MYKKKNFNLKEYQNTYINKTHLLLQKKNLTISPLPERIEGKRTTIHHVPKTLSWQQYITQLVLKTFHLKKYLNIPYLTKNQTFNYLNLTNPPSTSYHLYEWVQGSSLSLMLIGQFGHPRARDHCSQKDVCIADAPCFLRRPLPSSAQCFERNILPGTFINLKGSDEGAVKGLCVDWKLCVVLLRKMYYTSQLLRKFGFSIFFYLVVQSITITIPQKIIAAIVGDKLRLV